MSPDNSCKIVVVGGGTGGISVAARLCRGLKNAEVTVIEPSAKHYYQPLWTLVGGGAAKKEATVRDQSRVMPKGATWLQDSVATFDPDNDALKTIGGQDVRYDYLVVAPGIQLDWDKVKGLKGEVGKNGICSNYSYETVESTWENIRNFRGGKAVFTHPNTPIKCGGAPQKIMYLAADNFKRRRIDQKSEVIFGIASPSIFGVKKYADSLMEVIERYSIDAQFKENLVEVKADSKEAVFQNVETNKEKIIKYDMLHVTPPMSAPDFIKQSPLAAATGWVEVHKHTLQHSRFPNVFGLGDASNLPTSKTGAAIRKQAPVVAENIQALVEGKEMTASYDGYTSCPLVTGYGKLILAEFDYNSTPMETFPFDQSKERWTMYQLKKCLLPKFYWNGMLNGRA